jgi:hypothetical protein
LAQEVITLAPIFRDVQQAASFARKFVKQFRPASRLAFDLTNRQIAQFQKLKLQEPANVADVGERFDRLFVRAIICPCDLRLRQECADNHGFAQSEHKSNEDAFAFDFAPRL